MTEINLFAKTQELEAALRPIGLYVDKVQWHSSAPEQQPEDGDTLDPSEADPEKPPAGVHACVMECLVGAVAFSRRVQDAEQLGFDAEFAVMRRELEEEDFESKRAAMLQRISEGRDPFADD